MPAGRLFPRAAPWGSVGTDSAESDDKAFRSTSYSCRETPSLGSLSTYTQRPFGWQTKRVGPEPFGSCRGGPGLGVNMPVPVLNENCEIDPALKFDTKATRFE